MKIAIIGSGISGLSCAYALHKIHDITIFECADRIGGHTATIDINHRGKEYRIDTGFIVYNDWTYPNFIKLLERLKVKSKATEMSFSVTCKKTGLEYSGSNLNTLFAQRRNLFKPAYIGMLKDIIRFNRQAVSDLEAGHLEQGMSVGEYLDKNNYGSMFRQYYLTPMGSAIWSASLNDILRFPLLFFVRFFKNHGLLSVNNRPQWRVIEGGSSAYLGPLTKAFSDAIVLNSAIRSVRRTENATIITFSDEREATFDQVIFACHSDQALRLLQDPSAKEEQILGAIPYRDNEVVLHTDTTLLPHKKLAWASWNYHLSESAEALPAVSYNMNILQGIDSESTFLVTLNASKNIDPKKILAKFTYSHPVFSIAGSQAQSRWSEINGVRNTWFCGAYWRNGFHEDGCASGLKVATCLGAEPL